MSEERAPENAATGNKTAKPGLSPNNLIQGVLSKLGETFDSMLGRGARKESSIATSELVMRLKKLLDSQVRNMGDKGRFVPHIINLKVQWGKFAGSSGDSVTEMKLLEHELLAAAIDHINDNRYRTFAPVKVTAKADYFTEGVHLVSAFDDKNEEGNVVDLPVTTPHFNIQEELKQIERAAAISYNAEFVLGGEISSVELEFRDEERLSVGRTKENDLPLNHTSVSKNHAALALGEADELILADTGSTNGTYINGERIAYGQAYPITEADEIAFGDVKVTFRKIEPPIATNVEDSSGQTEEDLSEPAHKEIRIELEQSEERAE
jgi:pSer/pThr/pTyr-binding forkhead associated (FHA) protein